MGVGDGVGDGVAVGRGEVGGTRDALAAGSDVDGGVVVGTAALHPTSKRATETRARDRRIQRHGVT